MNTIPISRPSIGPPELKAVQKVLRSGHLAQGQEVSRLERAFAKFCGTRYAIACNNGTTALMMAIISSTGLDPFFEPKSWDDRPEVITTPFTFIATANSIVASGAKPVFVDIDPKTFNINPDYIENAITKKTIAILPVHLYGLPCEMNPIMRLAREHDLVVIEDACQAHGAEYRGKKAGSIGHAGAFSFYPTKNMTTGEGGMVTTNSIEIAEKCRMMRNQGQSSGKGPHKATYDYRMLGFNWRMTDISAALGLIQLRKLPKANKARARNAKLYHDGLEDCEGIQLPVAPRHCRHVWHQYTIRVLDGKRDGLREYLRKRGIGTGVYYPAGLYDNPVYKGRLSQNSKAFPETGKACEEVLSIPVGPMVGREDIKRIIKEIRAFI
jgi:dTDP-4-amino-4,6-dideoxygalactose transaminase